MVSLHAERHQGFYYVMYVYIPDSEAGPVGCGSQKCLPINHDPGNVMTVYRLP